MKCNGLFLFLLWAFVLEVKLYKQTQSVTATLIIIVIY